MSPAQLAVTPDGSPLLVPKLVTPMVICSTGIIALLIHTIGEVLATDAEMELTCIIPVASAEPQPPFNGME